MPNFWKDLDRCSQNYTEPPPTVYWTSASFAGSAESIVSDGSSFVVIAGDESKAYVSADGASWAGYTMGAANGYYPYWRAAYGGGTICTVRYEDSASGDKGGARSGDGGLTWTKFYMGTNVRWTSIAYGSGAFVAVAGVLGGTNVTRHSTNGGVTWTLATMPSYAWWVNLAWSGTTFCALAYGSSAAATSTNGVTWVARTLPSSGNWAEMVWGSGVFCVVRYGSKTVLTSPDGATWTQHLNALPFTTSSNYVSMAYNGSKFCVVNEDGKSAVSADGATWVQHDLPTIATPTWLGVAVKGSTFCAVAPLNGTVRVALSTGSL